MAVQSEPLIHEPSYDDDLLIGFLYGTLDLIKHYLPTLILNKTQNLSGGTLGLTEEECVNHNELHHLELSEVGTPSAELTEIREQKIEIENKYNSNFISASNISKIVFEFLFPIFLVFMACVSCKAF
jgi:hypothetical protein